MNYSKLLIRSILGACLLSSAVLFTTPRASYAEVHKSVSVGIDYGAILTGAFNNSDISGEAVGIGNEPQAMLPHTNLPGQREGEVSPYYENGVLAIVREDQGYVLINTQGEIITPFYKEIVPRDNGTYRAKTLDKKWVRLNQLGQEYPGNQGVSTQDDANLIAFKDNKTKKCGFKNSHGDIIIAPRYREIYTGFNEGRAFVKNARGQKVAIDESGTELFEAPYDELYPYRDGVAEYRRHVTKFGLSAVIGKVFSDFGTGNYRGSGILGYDNIKRGYVDAYGREIISSKNDKVYPMTPYGAVVENKGKLTVIAPDGQEIFAPSKYKAKGLNLTHGYIALESKDNHKVGIKSLVNGQNLLPFQYDNIRFLTYNLAVITTAKGQEIIRIDEPNRVLFTVSPDAKLTNFGTKGFMWVQGDTKLHREGDNIAQPGFNGYKVIDLQGDVVFEAQDLEIQKIGNFRHGVSPVKVDGKWGIINASGSWLLQPSAKAIVIL